MPHDYQHDIDAVARIETVPEMLQAIRDATGMGFVAVARVTADRWITCMALDDIDFGLKPGDELEVGTTICNEIRQSGEAVTIDDVPQDAVFAHHPVPAKYGFRSYISVPIYSRTGEFFGTLCAIDPAPADVKTARMLRLFELFASTIGSRLETDERLAALEDSLSNEREDSAMREEFMAVLSHDLRNPVAAVSSGARILLRGELTERQTEIVHIIRASTLRMSSMIDNLLDLARVRLGSGLGLDIAPVDDLDDTVDQVTAELQQSHPDRTFDIDLQIGQPVNCDAQRVGQLVSNLLGNALSHGARDCPIGVTSSVTDGLLRIEVTNEGEPIPPELMANLFSPYRRGDRPSQQGLGLGLYIAAQIAQAHGGKLDAESTAEITRFSFTMPVRPVADA